MSLSSSRRSSGFTLLELLTVMIIIAVLATLVYGTFEQFRIRSERVHCTANLRGLYGGLQSYQVLKGKWPQCPHKLGDSKFDEWWIEEMREVTQIPEKMWHCPTLQREQKDPAVVQAQGSPEVQQAKKQIHYMPTPYDENPASPRRWPTQPWLIEIGAMHGDGPLIIFPDGAVLSFGQFQRQGR